MDGNLENNQTVYNLNGKIFDVPAVDKTLTKSGYSADAKATGDALKELREAVSSLGAAAAVSEDAEVKVSTAAGVTYSNTASKLAATNVQSAIDELNTDVQEMSTDIKTLETNVEECLKKNDKPFDSYAGNGSATARTIATGGTGRLLMVYCSTHIAEATPKGTRVTDLSNGSSTWIDAAKSYYLNGNLFLNTDNAALNASGVSYNYQCI